jgi:asparagine synthase (glutamine-hydrolysing)
MSAQFGRWTYDGRPVSPEFVERVKSLVAPYGPDGKGSYIKTGISVLYQAFHTTKESWRETQPQLTESGAVITWDGRLDDRADLIRQLRHQVSMSSTDISIVAAAYESWGTRCFAKLIGDWALSIWDPKSCSLVLAKDPIGIRHLYYSVEKNQVTWSTILDPLVLFSGRTMKLCEEYIAGCLALFPAAHLTPYVDILSVPPSSFVSIRPEKQSITKYWDFDPSRMIRYRTDAEYEEHFRDVFAQAVRRRLRSDSPVLAELSGGMDSSSVVCMADSIIADGAAETPRLDTVSYYDDSEPNWNERPYFTKVEETRGRTGTHIDAGAKQRAVFIDNIEHFAVTPASIRRSDSKLSACMTTQGNRVVLSGIGGDEVTGGVPTPTPQLEDLLARGHLRDLAHELKVWALNKRTPWFLLLIDALRGFLPVALAGVPKFRRPMPWFSVGFIDRNREALRGYDCRLKAFGPLPSFQENLRALELLRRQLQCAALSSEPLYEKRYPYLDRAFLEFMYGVPREQVVRPGERRSLMRRSLSGVVPHEVLQRRRKGYVARRPITAISDEWTRYADLTRNMVSESRGIVRSEKVLEALETARQGKEVSVVALLRTLHIEAWLRNPALRLISDDVPDGTSKLKTSSVQPVAPIAQN